MILFNGGLYLRVYLLSKKKKTYYTSFMNFNHFGEPQLFEFQMLEVSHFCLTYNTLIVQINNTICHIFISSLPFLTFFCFSFQLIFFFFFGNFSLINNHINNICDLRNPSYNKLVHKNKNSNAILSLACILRKFNT